MKIPRRIHYCWFGETPMGKQAKQCLNSWQHFCPDYEIIRWDEHNSPLNNNDYVRQAYQARKWAFVSDFVRLKALCTQGGIYLDTDVELLRPLDSLLACEGFMGFESTEKVATCLMACQPEHPFFMEASQKYETRQFLCADGGWDDTTNVSLLTDILVNSGLQKSNVLQTVQGVTIYPSEFFSPKDLETGKITLTENSYAIHYFQASWLPAKKRMNTKIAQFLGPKLTRYIKQRLGRV